MTKGRLKLTLASDRRLRLEDYPGAINIIELQGPPAVRCAHLSLHRTDLTFAQQCLQVVAAAEDRASVAAEAAWRSALLHYCKCFGATQHQTGRVQLSPTRIFGSESTDAMKDHRHFMTLRNQHLVHDEGTHNFCAVGTVIHAPAGAPEIANITVAVLDSASLDDRHLAKLEKLVEDALKWVIDEFNTLVDDICSMLYQSHARSELATKKALGLFYKSRPPKRAR